MGTDQNTVKTAEGFDPVAYINAPTWQASRLGMDRIVELMGKLGNPQERMRVVHVAGTNGKGSTCAFTASILQAAGYTVGLFTSPYIITFNERIRVNGENISDDDLLTATLAVRDIAEAMDDHPTEFELMTAVALVHFEHAACDVVVLEVGLGGRLDSTNIVPSPGEKAGIIKRGAQVCVGVQPPEALGVIRAAFEAANADGGTGAASPAGGACGCGCSDEGASGAGAPAAASAGVFSCDSAGADAADACAAATFRAVDADALSGTPANFSYRAHANLHTNLLGSYQTQNAALAIEIAEALRTCGLDISDEAIAEGIAAMRWPGRFDRVAERPTFIVDGGHNPQGAQALADSLALNFPDAQPVFLIGILADKDFRDMLRVVVPLARTFVCVTPPNPRALPAADLAAAIVEVGRQTPGWEDAAEVIEADGFADAVACARELAGEDGLVVAFGSLYSISTIMDAL